MTRRTTDPAPDSQKTLVVILGPTATGKTAIGVELARKFSADVFSADARQLYYEMNIGTNKPNTDEQGGIKHHFIDSNSIHNPISVGQYEQQVLDKLESYFQAKQLALLVGGSGLYIQAVCNGLDEFPETDPVLRAELQIQYENKGLKGLVQQLEKLDPKSKKILDLANARRVIRALEVCLSSGKPYSSFLKQKPQPRPFNCLKVGLNMDREKLYQLIDQRVDQMLADGLEEEARELYPHRKLLSLHTLGYSELFDYFEGVHDIVEAIRLIKRNSRRYAKRQLTWWRKDEDIKWFEPEQLDEISSYVEAKIYRAS